MSTWVRSKWNPQATDEEKFEVRDVGDSYYHVHIPTECQGTMLLLKAHYVPCEGPAVWERVNVKIEPLTTFLAGGKRESAMYGDKGVVSLNVAEGYRVVSLVVERKR